MIWRRRGGWRLLLRTVLVSVIFCVWGFGKDGEGDARTSGRPFLTYASPRICAMVVE